MHEGDTLHLAMTRPALRWGAPLQWVIITLMVSCMGVVLSRNPLWMLTMPLMVWLAAKLYESEPHLLEIVAARAKITRTALGRVLDRQVYE